MPTISFDPDLLRAVHEHGPDIAPGALADAAGLSKSNIARGLANHRKAGLVKADALQLTKEGARLAGVSLSNIPMAERDTENSPASDTLPGASDTPAPLTAPWNQIRPSGLNYRKTFNQKTIDELAASLLKEGQLQEIVVRRTPPTTDDDVMWEVVAGERRWRAFGDLIDAGKLPANHPIRIHRRDLDDTEVLEIAVMENRQREDVHPLEEARAIAALQDAKLAEGSKSDARAVCREIGEKLGLTERWAQIRVNMVRRLSPRAQEAMMEGIFSSVKWADELGRWPHELQDQAIEQMQSNWNPISTEAQLKRWFSGSAIPVGKQPFEPQAYVDAGGVLSEPDSDGVAYFANSGLAESLAEKAGRSQAQSISAKQGYTKPPLKAQWFSDWSFPKAKGLKPRPPKDLWRVLFVVNSETLEVQMHHPVVKREDYEAWERDKEKAQAAQNPEPQVKPITKGLWKLGAVARTRALRKSIGDQHVNAMALMILALVARTDWRETLVRVQVNHPSGDAGELRIGKQHVELIKKHKLPGFNKEGQVCDRRKAMLSLMEQPMLITDLFATLVADLSIDCEWKAGPGAMDEALALAKVGYVEDPDGDIVDAAWAKKYTKAQQAGLIDAYGLFLDTDEIAGLKKGDADKQIAEAMVGDHRPIEARFVDETAARKLEAKLLKGKSL